MAISKSLRTKSIFFLQLSNVLFTVTAIFISLLSSKFDGYFTSFCRFLVGTALGFGQLALTKKPFRIVKVKPWLGRGIFGAIGMVLYYVAIALGSPGRASLLNNTYPIFVAIIAIFIMRDKVKHLTVIGLLLSFFGVALVLWDGAKVSFIADIIGLCSGVVAAVSYHFNKKASQTEDPIVIYLGVCLVGLAATAFSVPQALKLDWLSAFLLLLAGAGGYFAQIAITIGLRDIDTTEGSVHTFVKIPLTVIAGWLFLSDPITSRFILGTALLLVGLLLDQIITLVSRKMKRA
jgi:drug/metabolite transporter (DMT)-like permease